MVNTLCNLKLRCPCGPVASLVQTVVTEVEHGPAEKPKCIDCGHVFDNNHPVHGLCDSCHRLICHDCWWAHVCMPDLTWRAHPDTGSSASAMARTQKPDPLPSSTLTIRMPRQRLVNKPYVPPAQPSRVIARIYCEMSMIQTGCTACWNRDSGQHACLC